MENRGSFNLSQSATIARLAKAESSQKLSSGPSPTHRDAAIALGLSAVAPGLLWP